MCRGAYVRSMTPPTVLNKRISRKHSSLFKTFQEDRGCCGPSTHSLCYPPDTILNRHQDNSRKYLYDGASAERLAAKSNSQGKIHWISLKRPTSILAEPLDDTTLTIKSKVAAPFHSLIRGCFFCGFSKIRCQIDCESEHAVRQNNFGHNRR
jgi:hypothetical protein